MILRMDKRHLLINLSYSGPILSYSDVNKSLTKLITDKKKIADKMRRCIKTCLRPKTVPDLDTFSTRCEKDFFPRLHHVPKNHLNVIFQLFELYKMAFSEFF